MPDKKITVNALDPRSWDNFLFEVESYEQWLKDCSVKFCARLAEEGVKIASMNYQDALYAGTNDVAVRILSIEDGGDECTAVMQAYGKTVLFIEFGTGIAFANSYQYEHGFAPGSFGRRGLSAKGWLYRGEIGNAPFGTEPSSIKDGLVHTYGNPANASMWEALNSLERKLTAIAKEVFG